MEADYAIGWSRSMGYNPTGTGNVHFFAPGGDLKAGNREEMERARPREVLALLHSHPTRTNVAKNGRVT